MPSESYPPGLVQRILDHFWARGDLLSQPELDRILETGDYPWIEKDATGATVATKSLQQVSYDLLPPIQTEDRPPDPDPEHIKLAEVMYFIVQHRGIGIPKILEDYWGCHRTTVHRFFKLEGGKPRWGEYIRETVSYAPDIVDGKTVKRSLPALAMTGKGLDMWERLGTELSAFLPDSPTNPRTIGEAEPDATLHDVASRSNHATSLVATEPVQHVAPVAEPGIKSPVPSAWINPGPGLEDHLPSAGIVSVEKFCLAAQIAEPPGIEMPGDWRLSTIVNSRGGGRIKSYERRFGAWRFQITYRGSAPHLLKVMVPKRKGSQVWALITETESNAREYLRDICSMLEMRVYDPQGPTMGISVPSVALRKSLDDSVPAGCYVIVTDRETGETIEIDKSTNGSLGLADIEYSSLEDFTDAALSGRRAIEADERSQRVEGALVDIIRDLELQRDTLKLIAENQSLETGIIAKNQLRTTMEKLDG